MVTQDKQPGQFWITPTSLKGCSWTVSRVGKGFSLKYAGGTCSRVFEHLKSTPLSACRVAREEKTKETAQVKANERAKKQAQGKKKVQELSETIEESSPPSNKLKASVVDDDRDEWSSEKETPKLNSCGQVLKKLSHFVY